VTRIQQDGYVVTVELSGDDRQGAELLVRLAAEGARIHSFADKEPTLEDLFMAVTKGEVG
jgi:ABC-2 type transport system ATP-binding protein